MHRIFRRARRALLSVVVLSALSACGGGGGSDGGSTPVTPVATNNPPRVSLLATGDIRAAADTANNFGATVGGTIRLDAGASTDADNDPLSFEWSIVARPEGSQLALVDQRARAVEFKPDQMGIYTLAVKVTDGRGGQTTQQVSVLTDNRPPTATVLVEPRFTPVPVEMAAQVVTIGDLVYLNAEGSTDPDGHPLSVRFELLDKPSGSTATLASGVGRQASLYADVAGTYRVKVVGSDGRASFESRYTFRAENRPPSAVIVTSMTAAEQIGTQALVVGTVGYATQLDATGTVDPDNNLFDYRWELQSRPDGSQAALSTATGLRASLTPDLLGDYVVKMIAKDIQGGVGVSYATIRVANRPPSAVVSGTSNSTPIAQTAGPGLRAALGSLVTLRADGSTDADGDALSYQWQIERRPAGSVASLSSTTSATPSITPDRDGEYVFRLRVSDPQGAQADSLVTVTVGSQQAPVAVLDRVRLTVVAGDAARATASLSFDRDGDPLTYRWQIDSRPAGSAAVPGNPTSADLSFIPDVAGTYQASVVVSDGHGTSTAVLEVRALTSVVNSVSLSFIPELVRYSQGLDKLVISATNPNSVRIVDPQSGLIESVSLPFAAKKMTLSPNGRLAVVLHETTVSLIDLQNAALLHTSAAPNVVLAFVDDQGVIQLLTLSAMRESPIIVIDGRTGALLQTAPQTLYYSSSSYADGLQVPKLNKLVTKDWAAYSNFGVVDFDPASHAINRIYESPYSLYSSFGFQSPMFLSDSQDLLFTGEGYFFRTSDMIFTGRLSGIDSISGLSNYASTEETLVMDMPYSAVSPTRRAFSAVYRRYTTGLMLAQPDLPLPVLGGQQTYGLQVFHTAGGRHVLLVQSESMPFVANTRYYVVAR